MKVYPMLSTSCCRQIALTLVLLALGLSENSSGRGGPEMPRLLRSRSSTTLSVESLRRDASHPGHFRPAAIPVSFQTGLAGVLPITQAKEIEIIMPGPVNVSQVQFTDRLHGFAMGVHPKRAPGSAIVWTDDGGDNWNDATVRPDLAGTGERRFEKMKLEYPL